MRSIRCGRGLGDSVYLQGVVRHLVEQGERLEVRSDWPDVFRPLAHAVTVTPFNRGGCKVVAHYASRKAMPTTQFDDCCINAGITPPVDFRLDWTPVNLPLIDRLKSHGKPIVCVQLPRQPMDRKDGYGRELLPRGEVLQRVVDVARESGALTVQIGASACLYQLKGIDVDLANKTTVSDLIDVAHAADGFIGYPGFVIALSESFKKPGLYVWARAGLNSIHEFVRQITPQKIFQRPGLTRYVMDDDPDHHKAAHELCRQIGIA